MIRVRKHEKKTNVAQDNEKCEGGIVVKARASSCGARKVRAGVEEGVCQD